MSLGSGPEPGLGVLAMASSRIADDWQAAYGRRPLVAYTYVAPEHTGTCYAAAGWSCCDEPTSGMPPGHEAPGAQRRVWMKPLAADWKAELCAAPGKVIEEPRPVYLKETADWADHDPAGCVPGHQNRRCLLQRARGPPRLHRGLSSRRRPHGRGYHPALRRLMPKLSEGGRRKGCPKVGP